MKDEMKIKRDSLKARSKIAMQLVEQEQASTINEALVMMYAEEGHTEIHSFKKWLEMGYHVKRGEKALLLWGQPRQGLNQEPQTGNEKDEFKFYPLAYVFSQLQVQPMKQLTH
jgi:hypothetical protein